MWISYIERQGKLSVGYCARDFYRPKELSPSGQAYHWNNNADTYYLIGEGLGQAMLALLEAAREQR